MYKLPKCADCKYIRKLYVPPLQFYKDIPKDGFVCVCNIEPGGNQVMWLGKSSNGCCELFEEREDE